MSCRTAFVTGLTGSYLAELLPAKSHRAHGLVRRSSSNNTARTQHLLGAEGGPSPADEPGWAPKTSFAALIVEMVKADVARNE